MAKNCTIDAVADADYQHIALHRSGGEPARVRVTFKVAVTAGGFVLPSGHDLEHYDALLQEYVDDATITVAERNSLAVILPKIIARAKVLKGY